MIWKLTQYFGNQVRITYGQSEEIERHIHVASFINRDCIHFQCEYISQEQFDLETANIES